MIKTITVYLAVMVFYLGTASVNGQQLAFPGAEGYGKYTSGGRGGRVIKVTNLKDLNSFGQTVDGSLRAALSTSGTDPITIIFTVSGTILLGSSELKCSRPNITIAGQTAPGDGICIRKGKIQFSGDNIIIRYIRFRVGDELTVSVPCLDIENCRNIIVDHCSLSWAAEENMDDYDTKYTTVQYCILSEALYNSVNVKGARAYACQWGGQYCSYHHNLLASCYHRSPRINGCQSNDTVSLVDFRNNVVFNWSGDSQGSYGGEYEQLYPDSAHNVALGAGSFNNFVNNYYKPGPATQSNPAIVEPSYVRSGYTAAGYGKWYFNGNYLVGNTAASADNWQAVNSSKVGGAYNIKVTNEFSVSPVTTLSAQDAYTDVLSKAGAILPRRDIVDTRVVGFIKGDSIARGGATLGVSSGIIDSQSDVGGWPTLASKYAPIDSDNDGIPDAWETNNGLNPNDPTDGPKIASDGYSNLEHYLNGITGDTGLDTNPTGVSYIHDATFAIYPNPTNDKIYFDKSERLTRIEVYDLSGKIISAHMIASNNFISVSNLSPGLYLAKAIFSDGQIVTAKIVKK